ncbi:hypothetical protein ID866_12607 [Astraeus odoratus]|nr:hypothetical protein ID866_12607 [Astraeus odoratus]
MHDLHANLLLTPAGMTQLSLSHAHLMHTDAFAQLPLAWASESVCCCFLVSAGAATNC